MSDAPGWDKPVKAIVQHGFGPVEQAYRYEDIPQPVPGDEQCLVEVRAAGLNPLDFRLMRGLPLVKLLNATIRPGRDLAGRVEAVGSKVTRFKPGDEVFGFCEGSLAAFACPSERSLIPKPAKLTFEQAAAIPVAGYSALQALRVYGRLQAGDKVLINGASGGVGTFAVQMAKAFGAHVTGVCSAVNVELVRMIGADHVIDYKHEDFTRDPGARYDLILDCISNHSLGDCRRVLAPQGRFVIIGGKTFGAIGAHIAQALVMSLIGRQKFGLLTPRADAGDVKLLGELVASGKVVPVIDRVYQWTEVPEAMRYLEAGHARGKVVVTI